MAGLNRGLGPSDGIFEDTTALQAADISIDRRVEILSGTRYKVDSTDAGSGLLLASGNFANPISSADPQTAINTVAIDDLKLAIAHTGGGEVTAGGRNNQLRDSGAYTLPLADSVPANTILVVSLPDTFKAQTPTLTRAGSDLIRNGDGTDTNILFAGASILELTSNGVSEWEL